MPVSINAILLSGTATLSGSGVAAGLGKGVAAGLGKGVGVGLGVAVCGLGWATIEIAIIVISISAAKITLLIASPGKCSRIPSPDYTDCDEKEKAQAAVRAADK
jgi:hypothetical protein